MARATGCFVSCCQEVPLQPRIHSLGAWRSWAPWQGGYDVRKAPLPPTTHWTGQKLPRTLATVALAAGSTAVAGKQRWVRTARQPQAVVLAVITYLGVLLANTLVLQSVAASGQLPPVKVTVALHATILGVAALCQTRGARNDSSSDGESLLNAGSTVTSSLSAKGTGGIELQGCLAWACAVAVLELLSAVSLMRVGPANGLAFGSSAGIGLLCTMLASRSIFRRVYRPMTWCGAVLLAVACPVVLGGGWSTPAVAASLLAGLGLVAKEALLMTFRAPSSANSLPAASSSSVVEDNLSEQPDRSNLRGDMRKLARFWTPQVSVTLVAFMVAVVQWVAFSSSPVGSGAAGAQTSAGLLLQNWRAIATLLTSSLSLRLSQLWALTVLTAPVLQVLNLLPTLLVASTAGPLSTQKILGVAAAAAGFAMHITGQRLYRPFRIQWASLIRPLRGEARRLQELWRTKVAEISATRAAMIASAEARRRAEGKTTAGAGGAEKAAPVGIPQETQRRYGTALQRRNASILASKKLAAEKALLEVMESSKAVAAAVPAAVPAVLSQVQAATESERIVRLMKEDEDAQKQLQPPMLQPALQSVDAGAANGKEVEAATESEQIVRLMKEDEDAQKQLQPPMLQSAPQSVDAGAVNGKEAEAAKEPEQTVQPAKEDEDAQKQLQPAGLQPALQSVDVLTVNGKLARAAKEAALTTESKTVAPALPTAVPQPPPPPPRRVATRPDHDMTTLTKKLSNLIDSLEEVKSKSSSAATSSAGASAAAGRGAPSPSSASPKRSHQEADAASQHMPLQSSARTLGLGDVIDELPPETASQLNSLIMALNVVSAAAFLIGTVQMFPGRGGIVTTNNTTVLTQLSAPAQHSSSTSVESMIPRQEAADFQKQALAAKSSVAQLGESKELKEKLQECNEMLTRQQTSKVEKDKKEEKKESLAEVSIGDLPRVLASPRDGIGQQTRIPSGQSILSNLDSLYLTQQHLKPEERSQQQASAAARAEQGNAAPQAADTKTPADATRAPPVQAATQQEIADKEAKEAKQKAEVQQQQQREAEEKQRREDARMQKEAQEKQRGEEEKLQKEAREKQRREEERQQKEAGEKQRRDEEKLQKEAEEKQRVEEKQRKEVEEKQRREEEKQQKEAEDKQRREEEKQQKAARLQEQQEKRKLEEHQRQVKQERLDQERVWRAEEAKRTREMEARREEERREFAKQEKESQEQMRQEQLKAIEYESEYLQRQDEEMLGSKPERKELEQLQKRKEQQWREKLEEEKLQKDAAERRKREEDIKRDQELLRASQEQTRMAVALKQQQRMALEQDLAQVEKEKELVAPVSFMQHKDSIPESVPAPRRDGLSTDYRQLQLQEKLKLLRQDRLEQNQLREQQEASWQKRFEERREKERLASAEQEAETRALLKEAQRKALEEEVTLAAM